MNSKNKPAQLPHPWSSDALLAKAQRYAEEMLEHDHDDWRFAFWSSLTLELLARAALAHVSRALIADPRDWNHLLFALGHSPKAAKFVPRSIEISLVLLRLKDLLPEFELRLEGFAAMHVSRRNEELHSGATPFDSLGTSEWLPLFYETCHVLVTSLNASLESLFGVEEAAAAFKLIEAAKDANAKVVAKNIQAHRTVWEGRPAAERKKASDQASLWAKRQAGHRVKCPACNSDALVGGTPMSAPVQRLKDGLIIETQQFLPSRFECIACGLKIVGLALLHASGLGDSYKVTSTYDPAEYYSTNNDEYEEYEDDNNEP